MGFSFGGLGPAPGGTVGASGGTNGMGSAEPSELGFGSQGPASGGTSGAASNPGSVSAAGMSMGSDVGSSGGYGGYGGHDGYGAGSGYGGSPGEGGSFGLSSTALGSSLAALSVSGNFTISPAVTAVVQGAIATNQVAIERGHLSMSSVASDAIAAFQAVEARAEAAQVAAAQARDIEAQRQEELAEKAVMAAEKAAAVVEDDVTKEMNTAFVEHREQIRQEVAANRAIVEAAENAEAIAKDVALHDVKAAKAKAESAAVKANDPSLTEEEVAKAEAATAQAVAELVGKLSPGLQLGSVDMAHDKDVDLTYGINPDDGLYARAEPGTIPSLSQIGKNIVWGRSQEPDPRLESMTAEEIHDLEVQQQMMASTVATAAVLKGPVPVAVDMVTSFLPGALKYSAEIVAKTIAARAITPAVQELSDVNSDYFGQTNVVPGPGVFTDENIEDAIPSAVSIVAGVETQKFAVMSLRQLATVGVAIPEPLTTFLGLAAGVYASSRAFVAVDNALQKALASDPFRDSTPSFMDSYPEEESLPEMHELPSDYLNPGEEMERLNPNLADHLMSDLENRKADEFVKEIEQYFDHLKAQDELDQLFADLNIEQSAEDLKAEIEAYQAKELVAELGNDDASEEADSTGTDDANSTTNESDVVVASNDVGVSNVGLSGSNSAKEPSVAATDSVSGTTGKAGQSTDVTADPYNDPGRDSGAPSQVCVYEEDDCFVFTSLAKSKGENYQVNDVVMAVQQPFEMARLHPDDMPSQVGWYLSQFDDFGWHTPDFGGAADH